MWRFTWRLHRCDIFDVQNGASDWEIERKFVGIDYTNMLGEGAFGSVYMGRVLIKNIPAGAGRSIIELSAMTNNSDTVAVKMLSERSDSLAVASFRAEIDLMQTLGYHDRLVNMLACVTVSAPMLLISEYCSNGDLLKFLNLKRTYMLRNPEDNDAKNIITVKKQLMFAIQIAYGLEYLSCRGFIHRDVAARNILVDAQETCKLGDFGLCRAIGEDDRYFAQGGKLPLKWLPIEAMNDFSFSTASDVWSFGILLFEIVTLGGSPYAGWPAVELLTRLKRGDRMGRPDNCSDSMYAVMLDCWAAQPIDRPTFTALRQQFGDQLEDASKDNYDYYLKLDVNAEYYQMEHIASDESYVVEL